ncbi:hypothetical protein BDP55DRAFT_634338 [Colletotrichum godetiae]|uniref:Uncharacterized protein n=1 Tax=Colletotrichum godetiae TaxID=1209918 RepID=A0AAJ0ERS5_9PEZI|nr:uncharacterized protein BDP55DRAFT_634338 [Colletotrichum godetiae]KAK1673102.1 hypothetical protein BDP55DRAFT_634338 [Colletotrichum godetiae]
MALLVWFAMAFALFSTPGLADPQMFIPLNFGYYCPRYENKTEVTGERWQIGLSVPGGEKISVTKTYTVGITWTAGVSFTIGPKDKIMSIGMSFTISESVTSSIAQGVTSDCGDPEAPGPKRWRCSMLIIPSMLRVNGHLSESDDRPNCQRVQSKSGGKFEFEAPIVDKGGNPKWTYVVCTCTNLKHWADPGHPPTLCIDPCTRPEG